MNTFLKEKILDKYPKRVVYGVGGALALIIIVGLLILLSGGRRKTSAITLMPNNPAFVFETNNILTLFREVEAQPMWNNLVQTDYFNTVAARTQYFIEVLSKNPKGISLLSNRKITASVHVTSKEDFGTLFFVPVPSTDDMQFLNQVVSFFRTKPEFQFDDRNFKDFKIYEVKQKGTKSIFSFVIYKGFFIGSYSSVLIDDVIRHITSGESYYRVTRVKRDWEDLTFWRNGKLRMHVNPAQLPQFITTTSNENQLPFFTPLKQFAESALFAGNIDQTQLRFSGITLTNRGEDKEFMNVFAKQNGQSFGLKQFIPNNTAVMYHLSFNDRDKFIQGVKDYWSAQDQELFQRQKDVESRFDIKFDNLYKYLDKELAFSILEMSEEQKNTQKLLLLNTNGLVGALGVLKQMGQKVASKLGQKVTISKYGKVDIGEIPLDEFPAAMLGNTFQGFNKCYYSNVGQAVVLSNDIGAIRNLLDDVQRGDVWGKTTRYKLLLAKIKQNSNLTFLMNIPKAWRILTRNASPKWQKLMSQYENQMKYFQWITAQFNYEGDQFRSQIDFKFNGGQVDDKVDKSYKPLVSTTLRTGIYTPPYLMKNHRAKGETEILVQDYENRLHLVSAQGKPLWNLKMPSPMRSIPVQVDRYKNRKLQYAFITNRRIHLIDRVGRYVENFPIFVRDSIRLHSMSVLEFGRRNYRFLVTDAQGKARIFNHDGELIYGWKAKNLGAKLAAPAVQVKAGKSYIIFLLENGQIHAFDRRGKKRAGFPLSLRVKTSNPLAIDRRNLKFTCLSDDGELITFDINGEITDKKKLTKPYPNAKFKMCIDEATKDWIVVADGGSKITAFDREGRRLFEKDFKERKSFAFQYFNLDTDKKYLVVLSKLEAKAHILDYGGKAISAPLNSTKNLVLKLDPNDNRLMIYRTYSQFVGGFALDID
ncbi:hypothetical protein BKI52_01025 [marine bacterium AO1-C]|nr:hypothetical protein BKI52_01025 [marine bacterium AO1-C]